MRVCLWWPESKHFHVQGKSSCCGVNLSKFERPHLSPRHEVRWRLRYEKNSKNMKTPQNDLKGTSAHIQLMKDSGWRWWEVVALKSQRWTFIKLLSHFVCFHEWIQCNCILKILFKIYQHLWHCEDECMHLAQAWWHSFVGSASDQESFIRSWAETVHILVTRFG